MPKGFIFCFKQEWSWLLCKSNFVSLLGVCLNTDIVDDNGLWSCWYVEKFRCVLHIEEKERRRTQSAMFTATDRTGSWELGLPQGTQSSVCACSALVGSEGSGVQSLGDGPPLVWSLPTLRAYLSTKGGARGAPGYFRRLCLNHSQVWWAGCLIIFLLRVKTIIQKRSIACLPSLLQGLA